MITYSIDKSLPVIHPDKCCVECVHMAISVAIPGYSESTPGENFSMECAKDVWDYWHGATEDEYRDCVLSAKRCVLFEERGAK